MSISFFTEQTVEEQKPKNIYDLSVNLRRFIYSTYLEQIFEINPFMKNAIQYQFIDIDGDTNIDEDNGIINVYLKGFPEPIWRQILQLAMEYIKTNEATADAPKIETWNDRKEFLIKQKDSINETDPMQSGMKDHYNNTIKSIEEKEDQSAPRVARIQVTSMKVSENQVPELNWSNSNFNLIINQTLGYYPETYSFEPRDLMQKCQQKLQDFYKENQDSNVIQFNQKEKEDLSENRWEDQSNEDGPKMYTNVLGDKGIKSRLEALIRFCYWAIKNGKSQIHAG